MKTNNKNKKTGNELIKLTPGVVELEIFFIPEYRSLLVLDLQECTLSKCVLSHGQHWVGPLLLNVRIIIRAKHLCELQ